MFSTIEYNIYFVYLGCLGICLPCAVAVLLGQAQQAAVLGHVVVVGMRVGCMRMRRMRVGTIVRGCRMRHPGICGVASVCRCAVQVANLDMDRDCRKRY